MTTTATAPLTRPRDAVGSAAVTVEGLLPTTVPGFEISLHGLTMVGLPTLDQCELQAQILRGFHSLSLFWRADFILAMYSREDLFETRIDACRFVCRVFGRKADTLANNLGVASQFPLSRRRESLHLEFGHYEALRSYPHAEQERYLTVADEGRLSVEDLRKRLLDDHPERRKLPRYQDGERVQTPDGAGTVITGPWKDAWGKTVYSVETEGGRRTYSPLAMQVATLPAPAVARCSGCGDLMVRLASGAYGCLVCEDVCPTCGELRYGPDAPHVCQPNDNGHAVEAVDAGLRLLGEGDVVLADVFRTHDRGRGLEDAEPEYAPVRPAGMAAEVIYSFERQVTLCFDVTPDLRVRQRVRVIVEVVK